MTLNPPGTATIMGPRPNSLKIITWNVQRASRNDPLWDILIDFGPDIALLQEVTKFPDSFKAKYSTIHKFAARESGKPQTFGNAIAVKGEIVSEISLMSGFDWMDEVIGFFEGNLLGAIVETSNGERLNILSAYSPAWAINRDKLKDIDTTEIQLDNNEDVWGTEVLWCALRHTMPKYPELWIVGGDLNTSVLFDFGPEGDRGNRLVLQRLTDLGMTECLREYQGKIIPTYKDPRGNIDHQLDYLYVSNRLYQSIEVCEAGKQEEIFGKKISDHLPVVADFRQR